MDTLAQIAADPRVTVRGAGSPDPAGRAVVYWMQRAQRAVDNPALDVAVTAANALGKPVVVFLGIVPFYPRGNLRHYRFLVEGLADLARALERRRVGFVLRRYPDHHVVAFCEQVGAALVVGDENPLRETEAWRAKVAERLRVPLWTVDADVVVPSVLLEKEQYSAATIRPRIHRRLDEFLIASDEPRARARFSAEGLRSLPADPGVLDGLVIDGGAGPVGGLSGGTTGGLAALERFTRGALRGYATRRDHPEEEGSSRLSPYLHFGHLGPRAIALAVRAADAPDEDKDAFLEQLIVRRELAINFVRFNPRYDELAGCPAWALATLRRHARDPRPGRYDDARLEGADTGDPLWNAGQLQMVRTGWMHGRVRMYWAKKLLEWSDTPEEAFRRAVEWNDRYFLDGRDPNGYANIAWSIGGKHDRPWPERPIFGTVRFMSLASTSRKFDSRRYIAAMERLR